MIDINRKPKVSTCPQVGHDQPEPEPHCAGQQRVSHVPRLEGRLSKYVLVCMYNVYVKDTYKWI